MSTFEDLIRKSGGVFIDLDQYMEPDPNFQNQVVWQLSRWAHEHGVTYDRLGFIPQFLHTDDPRPALEQIDAAYQHGGGWREDNADGRWKLLEPDSPYVKLKGLDERPYNLVAKCMVDGDVVLLFDSAWCAIVHPDGSMNVARID